MYLSGNVVCRLSARHVSVSQVRARGVAQCGAALTART